MVSIMEAVGTAAVKLGTAALAFALACGATAADYPTRPIRIVDPFAPGGSTEAQARAVGAKLTEEWGQPVIIDARPGAASFHPAALLSLSAALCYALYSISTRILARSDSNETTLFYSNVVGALAMLPVVPLVWTTPSDPLVIALMAETGAIGSFGHYLLIAAHRLAPAAVLAPFIYSEIVLVTVLGFLVFGDLPNRWTIVGSAIVVGSGLYLIHREAKVRGAGR